MKKAILILSLLIGIGLANASPNRSYVRPNADSVYICLSKSSYAYHSHRCRGLAHCKSEIKKVSKAEAIKMGYKACKICYSSSY